MPPLHPKTELLEYFIKVGDGSRPVFQSVEMFDEKEERSIVTEVVCPESHVWWPRRHDPKALVEAFQAKRLPEAIRVAQIDHPKGDGTRMWISTIDAIEGQRRGTKKKDTERALAEDICRHLRGNLRDVFVTTGLMDDATANGAGTLRELMARLFSLNRADVAEVLDSILDPARVCCDAEEGPGVDSELQQHVYEAQRMLDGRLPLACLVRDMSASGKLIIRALDAKDLDPAARLARFASALHSPPQQSQGSSAAAPKHFRVDLSAESGPCVHLTASYSFDPPERDGEPVVTAVRIPADGSGFVPVTLDLTSGSYLPAVSGALGCASAVETAQRVLHHGMVGNGPRVEGTPHGTMSTLRACRAHLYSLVGPQEWDPEKQGEPDQAIGTTLDGLEGLPGVNRVATLLAGHVVRGDALLARVGVSSYVEMGGRALGVVSRNLTPEQAVLMVALLTPAAVHSQSISSPFLSCVPAAFFPTTVSAYKGWLGKRPKELLWHQARKDPMLTLTESVEVANPEPGTDRRGRGVQWHVATARLEDRFTGAVLQHTTAPLTNAEHAQEMAALEVVHLLMDRVYRPILTPLLESVGATMETPSHASGQASYPVPTHPTAMQLTLKLECSVEGSALLRRFFKNNSDYEQGLAAGIPVPDPGSHAPSSPGQVVLEVQESMGHVVGNASLAPEVARAVAMQATGSRGVAPVTSVAILGGCIALPVSGSVAFHVTHVGKPSVPGSLPRQSCGIFSPSLCKQRYDWVAEKLCEQVDMDGGPVTLVDVGCGEFKFHRHLAGSLSGSQAVKRYWGVDRENRLAATAGVDGGGMKDQGDAQGTSARGDGGAKRHKATVSDDEGEGDGDGTVTGADVSPAGGLGAVEFVQRDLSDEFAADPKAWGEMHGADFAAVIEVVEHVWEDRLPAFARGLFRGLRPRTVVLTTPNRDYNDLLWSHPGAAGMRAGNGLREDDHRFEWTREEFRVWVQGMAERYDYAVTEWAQIGTMVGDVMAEAGGGIDVGKATQAVVMRRIDKGGAK